ncbi:MAG: TOBE domain-containing protein [Campylobacteraceae bacterium]|nr:TOBE domain-containing protein [Campylobacteraceae bacterium]
MNSFEARIVSIERESNLHVVGFEVGKTTLWMMGLELPNVNIGDRVRLGFKSTSVTVAVNAPKRISFSNRIDAKIEAITHGKLLSSMLLHTDNGMLEAIMTNRAFELLEVNEGSDVTVFIKASEIAIREVIDD